MLPFMSLGDLAEGTLATAVEARARAALAPAEQGLAVFATSGVVWASMTVALTGGDVAEEAFQASVLSSVQAACTARDPSCIVDISSTAASSATSGTIGLAISRALATNADVSSSTVFQLSNSTAFEPTTAASASLSSRAEAMLAQLGLDVVASLPASMAASVSGTPSIVSVGVRSALSALGADGAVIATLTTAISDGIAADVGVQISAISLTITTAHPPSPPPASPPLPWAPPPPPDVPPGSPSIPPTAIWARPYYDGCNMHNPNSTADYCPDGCLESDWSEMYTWHGQGLNLGASEDDALYVWPGFRSNVTIKRCRTVVVDLDLSMQLYSIVVWGTLRIADRGPDSVVSVRSVCITVKPGGKVLAGEEDQPYSGLLEFLFTGDAMSESHHCGGLKGMTWSVGGEAEVKLYGARPDGRLWSRLRQTAEVGSTQALLMGRINFLPADRVVLGSTGQGQPGFEYATVTQVHYLPTANGAVDTWLTFEGPLLHKHLAVAEEHGGRALDMRGEVGLYYREHGAVGRGRSGPLMELVDSRGIPIRRTSFIRISGYKPLFNPKFRFRAFQFAQGLQLQTEAGSTVVLHGVALTDIGIRGATRSSAGPGVACGGVCNIRHALIEPRIGDGVTMGDGSHIENIVFGEGFQGVVVGGSSSLLHSFFVRARGAAPIVIAGCGADATIVGNAVSASELGLQSSGFCMLESRFANNTVHSSSIGWELKGSVNPEPAPGLGQAALGHGVVMWGLTNMAYWLYTSSNNNPVVAGMLVADASIGVLWSNVGPDPVAHTLHPNVMTIRDSVFVGRSHSNPRCGKITAIMFPVSTTSGPSISPGICGNLGGPHRVGIWGSTMSGGSYPALLSETRLTGNTFLRYNVDCGPATVLETLMEGGQNSADGVPPLFVQQTTIDDDSRANLADMKPPLQAWIVPAKCGVMDCDGPKQMFIHDLDGSLTGLEAGSSILARSEFMHERRANGDFTWYNIPAKMLYDPCPLVRRPASRTLKGTRPPTRSAVNNTAWSAPATVCSASIRRVAAVCSATASCVVCTWCCLSLPHLLALRHPLTPPARRACTMCAERPEPPRMGHEPSSVAIR